MIRITLFWGLLGFIFGFGFALVVDSLLSEGWSSRLAGMVLLSYPIILVVMMLSEDSKALIKNIKNIETGILMLIFFGSFILGVHSGAWIIQSEREVRGEPRLEWKAVS